MADPAKTTVHVSRKPGPRPSILERLYPYGDASLSHRTVRYATISILENPRLNHTQRPIEVLWCAGDRRIGSYEPGMSEPNLRETRRPAEKSWRTEELPGMRAYPSR